MHAVIFFGQHGLLLTGGEDHTIRGLDVLSGKLGFSIKFAHRNRIKGLTTIRPNLIASASSDGLVRVWDLRMMGENPIPIKETNTKARLTCLVGCSYERCAQPPQISKHGKKNDRMKDPPREGLVNVVEAKRSSTQSRQKELAKKPKKFESYLGIRDQKIKKGTPKYRKGLKLQGLSRHRKGTMITNS
eukprot:Gb_16772 [translate_table: standard]